MAQSEQATVEVTCEREKTAWGHSDTYYVEIEGFNRIEMGKHATGKKLAKTLAATLNAAGATSYDLLPPEWTKGERPSMASSDRWEGWAAEHMSIPARVAAAGKAAAAGYMKVVYRTEETLIATHLGVSEQTVGQYLSDLREGRR